MAIIFLGAGENQDLSSTPGVHTVYGGAGTESVTLGVNTEVTLGGNIELVTLPGNQANYLFQLLGTQIEISDAQSNKVATFLGLNQDTTLRFSDGESVLSLSGIGVATLGGQALSTGSPVSIPPATDTIAPQMGLTAPISYQEGAVVSTTQVLTTIQATDNVAVTGYSFSSGNDSNLFLIDSQGQITLSSTGLAGAANDFEVTPNTFNLSVVATDAAGNVSQPVTVSITVTNNTSDDVSGLTALAQTKSNVQSGVGVLPARGQTNYVALENTSGDYWQKAAITYSFNNSIPADYSAIPSSTTGFIAFPDVAKDTVRQTFSLVETFANLQFTEVSTGGDIRFNAVQMDSGTDGFAYYPGSGYAGDVFLNKDYTSSANYIKGASPVSTAVHEIGHALGLEHPHDGNILASSLDNTNETVMSYKEGRSLAMVFTQTGNSLQFTTSISHSPSGFQVLDVGTLQAIYGANLSYNVGATTYLASQVSTGNYFTLWDAGGEDLLDLSSVSHANLVDLRPGKHSSVDFQTASELAAHDIATYGFSDFIAQQYTTYDVDTGQFGGVYTGKNNLAIAEGVWLENVTTGSGNDTVQDNSVNNIISTGAGNDIIKLSEGGFDSVDGGSGTDVAVINALSTAVQSGLENGAYYVVGAGFAVSLVGIESIQYQDTVVSLV